MIRYIAIVSEPYDVYKKQPVVFLSNEQPDVPYVKIKITEVKIEKRYIMDRKFSEFTIKWKKIKSAIKELCNAIKS